MFRGHSGSNKIYHYHNNTNRNSSHIVGQYIQQQPPTIASHHHFHHQQHLQHYPHPHPQQPNYHYTNTHQNSPAAAMTAGGTPQSSGIKLSSSMDTVGQQQSTSAGSSSTKPKQRFEIMKKLGSGTYGKVSLAHDHKLGHQIAVKIIKKNAIENAQDLIRIRREIRIMSALKHPNIIEIKEVFENDDKIIIVMEYADGGELYDYVSQHGPLSEDDVCRLFRQIVSAVFYCHKHGVVHRDLKLENILLDKNMSAKIADFGLSNYFTQHGLLHTFCGSPLYASPEIINGVPYRGPEVDCWSLGVLLYTLAYSSMPFDGRDFNRMIRQIKKGIYYEPDPPSSASMLIRAMLRVNPERRADIDIVASHWWLNFDENLPSIHDLPENQVLDPTPLCQRKETIIVQNYVEDSEMFSEYNYLSVETRKKIDEFRRRRREADQYVYDSIHPKRANRTQEMNDENAPDDEETLEDDPLQRLRDLESRLLAPQQRQQKEQQEKQKVGGDGTNKRRRSSLKDHQGSNAPSDQEGAPQGGQQVNGSLASLPPQQKKAADSRNKVVNMQISDSQDKDLSTAIARSVEEQSYATAQQEEGNRLVNQLLEEAEKGVVPVALMEKIKASDAYRTQNFVKEIVDSMLDFQQHQQQQILKIKKPSVTKMSTMARQNSKDVAPNSSSRTKMTNSMLKQNSKDQNSLSLSLDSPELPDLVKNQKAQDSSFSFERPPDLVADDQKSQQNSKFSGAAAQDSLESEGGAQEYDYNSKKDDLEGIEEEDVDSTDFEDLEIDDDEEELASLDRNSGTEESPADSFVTATDVDGTPRSTGPGGQGATPSSPVDDEFPPGLSKRLSRGKYEKSKFIFENSARKTHWLKTMDPDMGSSQEIESPPRSPSMTEMYRRGTLEGEKRVHGRRRGSHNSDTSHNRTSYKLSTPAKQTRHYNAAATTVPLPFHRQNHQRLSIDELNNAEDDKHHEEDEYTLPPQILSPRDSSHHLQKRNRKFNSNNPQSGRVSMPNQHYDDFHHLENGYHQDHQLSFAQALLSPRYDQSSNPDKKNDRNFAYKSPVGGTNLHKDEPYYVSDNSHLATGTDYLGYARPHAYMELPLHVENPHYPVRNNSTEFTTGYPKRTNLASTKSKSIHDLSPERNVLAAKQYLEENPDIAAERRKHKSWYEGSDKPVISAQPYLSRALSPEPLMITNSTYHPEVYQPRSMGVASSPYYKSRYDADNVAYRKPYLPESDMDQPPSYLNPGSAGGSSKFKVFQPKGLLKRRSRSVEKGLYEDSVGAETDSGGHPSVGFYQAYQPPSSINLGRGTMIGLGSEIPRPKHGINPLKGILKKTSHYGGSTSMDEDAGAYKSSTPTLTDPYRNGPTYGTSGTSSTTGAKPNMNFIGKIRRHLSSDKPLSTTTSGAGLSKRDELLADYPSSKLSTNFGVSKSTPSYYSSSTTGGTADKDSTLDKDKPGSATRKKRSLLQLGRRKTTELRYGAGGTVDTSTIDDPANRNRRASSPLDKIKGLFSVSNSPASKIGTRLKDHGSTLSSGSTKEPPSPSYTSTTSSYMPSYRKPVGSSYQPSFQRPHSSYAPKSKYSWQEDSNLY